MAIRSVFVIVEIFVITRSSIQEKSYWESLDIERYVPICEKHVDTVKRKFFLSK